MFVLVLRGIDFLKIRHKLEYILLKILIFFVRFFGIGVFKIVFTILFAAIAPFILQKIKKRYRLARYNLSVIGCTNPSKLRMFFATLRYIESFVLFTAYGSKLLTKSSRFNVIEEGAEYIEDLKKQEKGFIVVSFHYGNWEIFPTYLKHRFNINNYFVYKEQKNSIIDDEIKKTRSGLEGVLPLKKGAKDIALITQYTKNGEAVDILIDQIQHIGSEPINLFGKRVKIGFTIQKIAVKNNIPIVPTFCFIDKNVSSKRYKMVFHKPIEFGDVSKDVVTQKTIDATQQISDIAMNYIKQDPYQWFCLFYKIFGEAPNDFI